jgi:putative ABC transport system permease protein
MPPAIQKQVQLPLRKAVDIALRSLRVRVGRSLLTILTIIMAIAFLTYIWSMRSFEPATRIAYLAAQGVLDPAPPPSASRTLWLITLSLLVCTVGIANAMLMSVMERFREIGTMKCLGALDSFILKLFFLESLFLGAVGTLLGVLLGLAASALMLLHSYGSLGWTHFHATTAIVIGLGAAAIGLFISAAAALFPAWKAARMQPVAAMRVDV